MPIRESEVEIVPYDPRWSLAFESEAVRLRNALGCLALRIDHNGSTAIPGLAAKPIIDIQVSVAALQPMAVYGAPLWACGYIHVPDPDDSFCPFFHRPFEWPHTQHIHVVQMGSAEERRTLAFRDYLREHGDSVREYELLKRDLATRLAPRDRESREAYARAKADFIERILGIALTSGYPRNFSQAGETPLKPLQRTNDA